MSDYFLLYLFTRLDAIRDVFTGLFISLFIVFIIAVLIWICLDAKYEKEDIGKVLKVLKISTPLLIISFLGVLITPTKQDVLFIVGGKLGIDISQSKEVEDTGKKLYQLLQKKLDEELKE